MRTQRKANVLLVEAEPVLSFGLRQLINTQPNLTVCAEAATLPVARAACEKWHPELVVLDVGMNGGEGFALVKELPRWHPAVAVVAFTALEDMVSVTRALRAGAWGYATRKDSLAGVLAVLAGVLRGERTVSPRVERLMLETVVVSGMGTAPDELAMLSERERQVFTLMGEGRKTGALALELGLSVKTVETHQKHIREKLRLRDGAALLRRATLFQAGRASASEAS